MQPDELIKFQRSLERLNYTRERMENLYRDSRVNETDMDSVYEALFLRAVTGFESFLEDLFLAILEERIVYPKNRVRLKMTVGSRKALLEILLQGSKYMNWLPFNNTVERATIYLRDGKPFSELNDGDRSMIKTITLIRHAIAHKSSHAMDQFNKIIVSMALLQRERKPAGFLRSKSGARTRFEIYLGELGRLAADLC